MTNCAVIGLGFGDEGKGVVTDYLCSQFSNPLVIRFTGGHQAGHTVVDGDKRHIFSNFGSGTLKGHPTFWSKFCTVDPPAIINELNLLVSEVGPFQPQLFVDGDCPITTPYDKFYNRQTESSNQHGSCGVGFGATIEREEKHYSLHFSDLFYPEIFKIKYQMIAEYYRELCPINSMHEDIFDTDLFKDMNSNFLYACEQLPKLNFIEQRTLESIFCSDYVFEGSQGLLLDQNFGFFPHVTRSNTGSANAVSIVGTNIAYYLVTRAYQTRHGNGPMTNEKRSHTIMADTNETNVDRKWQGKFRRSLLDVDLLEYAINKDKNIAISKNKTLVITCLDHISKYRFTHKGNIVDCVNEEDFVTKIADILEIENVMTNNSPDSKDFKKMYL